MTAFTSTTLFSVHHLLIVDMNSTHAPSQKDLISRVNDTLDSIREAVHKHKSQQHRVTVMTITQGLIKCVNHDLNINEVQNFNEPLDHKPNNKGLYDAIGGSIATWKALSHLRSLADSYQVSIFSNGKDQGSKKYTACSLKSIVTSLSSEGWKFTMIGSGSLFPQTAKHLGINNYYICRPPRSTKERNFLISQLRRQWRLQQVSKQLNEDASVAA